MKVGHIREIQERKFKQGVEILEMSELPAFKVLLDEINQKIESVKLYALEVKSYEELCECRGEIRGLRHLQNTLDVFVNKAKAAKRTL